MIVDTSAIVAILRDEPDGLAFARVIAAAAGARMSAATYVELGIVVDGARDAVLSGALDTLLTELGITIEPLSAEQARIARDAYRRFGRGSGHAAGLNMGDCYAYALARDRGEPLLFKGDDFGRTDIELIVEPVRARRLSEVLASYASSG